LAPRTNFRPPKSKNRRLWGVHPINKLNEAPMLRSIPGVLRRRFVLEAVLMLLLVTVILWNQGASAHSWYPWERCSDNDCAPISTTEVPVERDGGFDLVDGRHISYKDVRPSPDGQWHLCEQKSAVNARDRRIICVYAPIGGF
jgi:hypothetical protein